MQRITIYCDNCGREIRFLIDQNEVRTWIRIKAEQIQRREDVPDLCITCQERLRAPEEDPQGDHKSRTRVMEAWSRMYADDESEDHAKK